MMKSKEIRAGFLSFFAGKGHKIVDSDTMVIKNDPTLMFTNAGMNQFKDIFLGNRKPDSLRVTDAQKCLRVSGKHNDLDEVGHDTYHHTMFEMLGNWSFGDYFKAEAIAWAWEYLTEVVHIDKERLYVTVFTGEPGDGLRADDEAKELWLRHVAADRIIGGNKKDNFWEMGDMGPCGPCSEIHIDLRSEAERQLVDGRTLVNTGHPQVIEIWNLVFIEYNRKADGSLENLPQKHVDTGMGFERLCMVLQHKQSNYDTDVFTPLLDEIGRCVGISYGQDEKIDVAMRVVADHLRAVSFAIADGQLPSNVKAGYVIRRILRRAIRYYYSFLNRKTPLVYSLVSTLCEMMGDAYPELKSQQNLIEKVIYEEENAFLNTLEKGIKMLENIIAGVKREGYRIIGGKEAFILYDTYGFPFDLTDLIARENGLIVNKREFNEAMNEQKSRARKDAAVDTGDWTILRDDDVEEFVGYDLTATPLTITRYRKIKQKDKDIYQLVFNVTPFYAECGGQIGDTGYIEAAGERIDIIDTKNENGTTIHLTTAFPHDATATFEAVVDLARREAITSNHTATHLMHNALRKVLGTHVEQKGSLVNESYLRFDFSHFQKMTAAEIRKVERLVNESIRADIALDEKRNVPLEVAKTMGAMALFGEKYGDTVRVIRYGDSVEFCGGTHVKSTGRIGFFKIVSESAIAAGIRRIEAITGSGAENYIYNQIDMLTQISGLLNNPKDVLSAVTSLSAENQQLKKDALQHHKAMLKSVKNDLLTTAEKVGATVLIFKQLQVSDSNDLKEIASQIRGEVSSFACVLGAVVASKPYLSIAFSDDLVNNRQLHAGNLIRESAKLMQGGGGGQAFIATAGGKNAEALTQAINFAAQNIKQHL